MGPLESIFFFKKTWEGFRHGPVIFMTYLELDGPQCGECIPKKIITFLKYSIVKTPQNCGLPRIKSSTWMNSGACCRETCVTPNMTKRHRSFAHSIEFS